MKIYGLAILLCLSLLFIPKYSEAQTASSDDTSLKQTLQLLEKHFSEIGDIFFDKHDYISAISYYDKALRINSTDANVLFKKGLILDTLGQHTNAIVYYDKVLIINPDNVDALYNKGFALEELGQKDNSVTYYKKVLEINPDYSAASTRLNLMFNNVNNQTISSNEMPANQTVASNEIPTNQTVASNEIPTNQTVASNEIPTNQTVASNEIPTNQTVASNEVSVNQTQSLEKQLLTDGNALFNQGNYTEAITYYDKALLLNATNIETLYNKALSLDNLGRLDEAITYYDKVLQINPNDTDTLNNKGLALDNLGKHDQAIKYFDKVLTINPEDTDALYNKGHVLEELGKKNNATAFYKKVLEINPSNTAASAKLNLTFNNANKTSPIGTQKADQTLEVVVGLFVVLLICIIIIDQVTKRTRNSSDVDISLNRGQEADQV